MAVRDEWEAHHETLGLRAWAGKSGVMPWAHHHHELELNYVLQGTLTYLIAGSLVTLPTRRLCALWGAVPHQLIESRLPAPEVIWVTVPLAHVLAWKLPRTLVPRLLREGIVIEREEHPGDPALLQQWIADLGQTTAKRKQEEPRAALLEIEARLWRMASRLRRAERGAGAGAHAAADIPAAVERLAQFLAGHYREAITMEDAARVAHVHPHYAMTLFRRHTGLTLHGYLTLQRVAHAQRLLATTARPILDIGFESGFVSTSRFYEAFKARTGLSPRRFRLRLAGPLRPGGKPSPPPPETV